jgi:hypothetical protein
MSSSSKPPMASAAHSGLSPEDSGQGRQPIPSCNLAYPALARPALHISLTVRLSMVHQENTPVPRYAHVLASILASASVKSENSAWPADGVARIAGAGYTCTAQPARGGAVAGHAA